MAKFVDTALGRVWCDIAGAGSGLPLLVLHGGPGLGHDYLRPLRALAPSRPVILFDQPGCGRSDMPPGGRRWDMQQWLADTRLVHEALGTERVVLLGHSTGGWLAMEYALAFPDTIAGLVLASTSVSCRAFEESVRRLIASPVLRAPADADAGGAGESSADDPAAVARFMEHFVCRLQPWPQELLDSLANVAASPVFAHMLGDGMLSQHGTLRGWSAAERLAGLTAPTLVTCGRFDEMGPACAEALVAAIADAELAVFEASSHVPHLEEPAAYLATLAAFLQRVDAAERRRGG